MALQEVPSREAGLYRQERIFPHQVEIYDPALNHPNFPDDKAFVILSKYPVAVETEFKPFKQSRPIVIVRVSVPDASFCLYKAGRCRPVDLAPMKWPLCFGSCVGNSIVRDYSGRRGTANMGKLLLP